MSTVRLLQTTFGALLLAVLLVQHGEAAAAPPALYTQAQARLGQAVFAQNCASCHGQHLEGRVGPALKGPTFASPAAGLNIQQVFEFFSVEMPAYAPGSLPRAQYVEILAFLLQENGYPAGRTGLTDQIASRSTVALLYHEPHKPSSEVAKTSASAGKPAKSKSPPQAQPTRGKPLAASLVGVPSPGLRMSVGAGAYGAGLPAASIPAR